MIIGIVAIAKNFAIGRSGSLPWHYTEDLRHFKETTMGNAVVMGSNTWRAIGKPLPGRQNIVLSRTSLSQLPPGVLRFSGPDDVVAFAKDYEKDVFIIGGRQIYSAMADRIEKWIVTEIPLVVADADTFMPEDFLNDFEMETERDLGSGLRVKYLYRK